MCLYQTQPHKPLSSWSSIQVAHTLFLTPMAAGVSKRGRNTKLLKNVFKMHTVRKLPVNTEPILSSPNTSSSGLFHCYSTKQHHRYFTLNKWV